MLRLTAVSCVHLSRRQWVSDECLQITMNFFDPHMLTTLLLMVHLDLHAVGACKCDNIVVVIVVLNCRQRVAKKPRNRHNDIMTLP